MPLSGLNEVTNGCYVNGVSYFGEFRKEFAKLNMSASFNLRVLPRKNK